MWQKRDDDGDLFYMVGECALEELSQHLRWWIKLARTLGEMQSGMTRLHFDRDHVTVSCATDSPNPTKTRLATPF